MRGVAGATTSANASASRDLELVVVAVEAFLRLAGTVGDVEAAIEEHGAIGVSAIVGIAVGIINATVDGEVLGCVHGIIFHGIGLDVASVDGQRGLAFDALTAFVLCLGAMHGDVATVDGQVALGFDAFRVGIVATAPWAATTLCDGDALTAGGDIEGEVVIVGTFLPDDKSAAQV